MVWKLCTSLRLASSWSSLMRRKHDVRIPSAMVSHNLLITAKRSEHNLTDKQKVREPTEVDLTIKYQEEVDNDDDDDDFDNSIMEHFINRAKSQMDEMDDIEYHDVTSYDKRVFLKVVDVWLDNVGPTKKGHREFVRAALNSLDRFKVENDVEAYIKLLDCYPHGQHTGIKRHHRWNAAFQDKHPDHLLGEDIMRSLSFNQVQPDGRLYDKAMDLFGMYSPVTRQVRNLLFWNPRLLQFSQFPVTGLQVDAMDPIDIAFRGLRQMSAGDVGAIYKRIEVPPEVSLPNDKPLDMIVSCQGEEQKRKLALHDPKLPIYIQGPNVCYYAHKKVQYYVMRSSPPVTLTKDTNDDEVVMKVTSEDWWSKFYKQDWESGRKLRSDGAAVFDEENFLPEVEVSEEPMKKLRSELEQIEDDFKEGDVYAIAATDHTSVDALRCWVGGLLVDNSNISNCNILFRPEEKCFMIDTPLSDPNDEDDFF